jgi:PTH1 family peptidyl-tRNA hydrolase
MYLIVGLGNPGREYAGTRHNVGFMCLDLLAEKQGWQFSRRRARAVTAEGNLANQSILLAKPQTFMNLSGLSVAELARFHRIPLDHLLVIHDDLDLPVGKLRLRERGSAGGQRGMHSIISSLGTQEIPRLRVGIGRSERIPPEAYVLQNFSKDEQPVIALALDKAILAIESFITEVIAATMNRFNVMDS